jgi:hypothetical protein
MTLEMLTEDLLYAEDGHASDVVLTCLADGENAIVPQPVRAHVAACPTCQGHLGNAALLSLRAQEDVLVHLRKKADEAAREARGTHSPYVALALGLALAVVGALPRLARLPEDLASGTKSVTEDAPSFLRLAHHGILALRQSEMRGALVSIAAGLLLVALAAVVARRASRSAQT